LPIVSSWFSTKRFGIWRFTCAPRRQPIRPPAYHRAADELIARTVHDPLGAAASQIDQRLLAHSITHNSFGIAPWIGKFLFL